jgi:Tfp pilus assembly protein PilO
MKYSIIIISVALIISFVVGALLVWPEYKKMNDLQTELAKKDVQLESQHKYNQQLETTSQQLKEKQEFADKVDSILPKSLDMSSLLEFLQTTCMETGMSLEGVSWQELSSPQEKETRIKEYSVNLELSGSYFAFKNFLFSLEKSARLIDIMDIDFFLLEDEEQSMPFKITLRIYSY